MRHSKRHLHKEMLRLGTIEDIPQLKKLNRKWLWENLTEAERKFGFLTCDAYTDEDFENIIKAKEIVVAQIDGKIVGYYLFDNYSKTNSLKKFDKFIQALCQRKLINAERLSKRAQVVIERPYQGNGLYKKLVEYLHESLKIRYDKVFSVVYKSNPKISIHKSIGWTIVEEDSEKCFVVHNL